MSQISVSDRTPPVAASEMTVHSDTVSPLKKKRKLGLNFPDMPKFEYKKSREVLIQ